jgi:hypothetical protein
MVGISGVEPSGCYQWGKLFQNYKVIRQNYKATPPSGLFLNILKHEFHLNDT